MGDNSKAVDAKPSSDVEGDGNIDTLEKEQGDITDKGKNDEIEDKNATSNSSGLIEKVALSSENEEKIQNQNNISADGEQENENKEKLTKNNDDAAMGKVPAKTEEEREKQLNAQGQKGEDEKKNNRSVGENDDGVKNKSTEEKSVATSNEKESTKSDTAEEKKSHQDKNIKTNIETAKTVETESKKATNPQSPPKQKAIASTKKSRPPYRFDPNKITVRFLFANRDGLTVTVECKPNDTVGEVKGALISVWPEDLPVCAGGDSLRLVCMGKGLLMPDSRTLEDCQVPVFKTHPTPVNVSIKPNLKQMEANQKGKNGGDNGGNSADGISQSSQGCACIIL